MLKGRLAIVGNTRFTRIVQSLAWGSIGVDLLLQLITLTADSRGRRLTADTMRIAPRSLTHLWGVIAAASVIVIING